MADVFLSHASSDRALAEDVCTWLEADGHKVFLDTDADSGILVGERWKERLYHELGRADAVVCLVTKDYIDSKWCTAELAVAVSRGCLIIPLRTDSDVVHPLVDEHQHTSARHGVARSQVLTRLRRLDANGRRPWRDGENPYPGLAPFSEELSGLYFGRSQEIRELAARVRLAADRTVIAVAGPSGCGKSSLMRAGLLPVMETDPDWIVLPTWGPGDDPMRALARALAEAARGVGLAWTVGEVRTRLDEERGLRDLVDEVGVATPGRRDRQVLLPIDQAEELFGQRVTAESRTALAARLAAAMNGSVTVVLTIRSEYLDDLTALLPGDDRLDTYVLGPLVDDMLRVAIEEPATIAGLRLEAGLSDRLIADTGTGDALPLLAFTLQQLADGLSRGDFITLDAYADLGARHGYRELSGVQAVLADRADDALEAAARSSGLSPETVLVGLVRLVDVDPAGRWVRRAVPEADLTGSMHDAITVFVDQRLLTSDGTEVRFIHEALLTAWPPLTRAIEERGDALRAARAVEQAAVDWRQHGSKDGYLWDEERLTATTVALNRSDDETAAVGQTVPLGPDARAFLDATRGHIAREHRAAQVRRARVLVGLSVLLVAALVAGVIAFVQAGRAQSQRDAATARELIARADAARASNPALALQLGLAAQAVDATNETSANLTRTLTMNSYAATLTGHTSSVFTVAFSPDGRVLASGDGDDHSIRLWDVSDRLHPRALAGPLTDHTDWVLAAAFSPNGRLLATESLGEVILWDVADPARPAKLQVVSTPVSPDAPIQDQLGLAFDTTGRLLVTTNGGAVRLWSLGGATAALTAIGAPLGRVEAGVAAAALARDGNLLAVAAANSDSTTTQVTLWDLHDTNRPSIVGTVPLGSGAYYTSLAFDPDRPVLAIGTGDFSNEALNAVMLWNVANPAAPAELGRPLTTFGSSVRAVAFGPGGKTLATGSEDRTVLIWDVTDPAQPQRVGDPLADHTNSVYSLAYAPDGALASGSADNTIRLWTPQNAVQPVRMDDSRLSFTGEKGTLKLPTTAFGLDGRALVTTSSSGAARLWDLSDPAHPSGPGTFPDGTGPIYAAVFAPDGQVLATGGASNASQDATPTVMLWDVGDPLRPVPLSPPLTGHASDLVALHFTTDGRALWSADESLNLIRWDVSDPRRPSISARAMEGREDYQPWVAFRPDSRAIVTGSGYDSDATILRDITDPATVHLLENPMSDNHPYAMVFGPDGKLLVTAGDDVLLWDVSTAWQPRRLGSAFGIRYRVESVAMSGDGRTLAVGGGKGDLTLWDITDPTRPFQIGAAFAGHNDTVGGLAFSPDGRMLVSADESGGVALWDLSRLHDVRDDLAGRACSRARRGLTPEEWTRYVGPDQPFRQTCG